MESAWPAAVRRGHWALAASMACLASAVVSGGGVAWQPSAAARSAGTHQMGRMTDLRWGKADRKSTRLNSSHGYISYAVFCLKKKKTSHTVHAPTAGRITT